MAIYSKKKAMQKLEELLNAILVDKVKEIPAKAAAAAWPVRHDQAAAEAAIAKVMEDAFREAELEAADLLGRLAS